MRRFVVEPGALEGSTVRIGGGVAHRLAKVLRLKSGERVAFFDGSGTDVVVMLSFVSDKTVTGEIIERVPGPNESSTAVHLYQSITKGDRFEWLVEKATEIGVARIVPLLTARAVVKTAGEGNRVDRWRRIAVEAAEQCGRSYVPAVEAPQAYSAALGSSDGLRLLPFEGADDLAPSIPTVLHDRIDELYALSAVSIFIGPEGGYEDGEVDAAQAAGASVVTLGQRVLRSETAGLVAATLVMQACGELG